MMTAHIWRIKMSLELIKNGYGASLLLNDDCTMLQAFIDVYCDDTSNPSPFKTSDECEKFLVIIKNILEIMYDFK